MKYAVTHLPSAAPLQSQGHCLATGEKRQHVKTFRFKFYNTAGQQNMSRTCHVILWASTTWALNVEPAVFLQKVIEMSHMYFGTKRNSSSVHMSKSCLRPCLTSSHLVTPTARLQSLTDKPSHGSPQQTSLDAGSYNTKWMLCIWVCVGGVTFMRHSFSIKSSLAGSVQMTQNLPFPQITSAGRLRWTTVQ